MLENQIKLDIYRDGVWCIADIGTDDYIAKTKESESQISSLSQQKIGRKVVYLYLVIIFCFIIKRALFIYVDKVIKMTNYKSSSNINFFHKLVALDRYICYRRLPTVLCRIFQLPISLGSLIMIVAGFLYVLCYLFIPKFWYRACLGFGGGPLAIRGGHEAIALIPLIYILSGKTNFVTAFTGVSYEKLVVFHRWISFICCFCAWVHTIPFYVQPLWEGGKERLAWYERTHWTYYTGIPPIVFLTVLVIFSHSKLRGMWYEIWLKLHWICALGLYISLFYHCNGWTEGTKYMIATGAFWVFQIIFKFFYKEAVGLSKKGIFKANKCHMIKFESDMNDGKNEFFELIIDNSLNDNQTKDFTWHAGQHCFIRFPGIRMLERHPFSIISIYRPKDKQQNIKLILKAKGRYGMTKTLYKKISNESHIRDSKLYVDGPYGGIDRDINAFTNIYLISTGTGITGVLPYYLQCCEYMKRSDSVIQSVQCDWIIRSCDNIEWIMNELEEIKNEIVKYRKFNNGEPNRFKFNIFSKDIETSTSKYINQVKQSFNGIEEFEYVHVSELENRNERPESSEDSSIEDKSEIESNQTINSVNMDENHTKLTTGELLSLYSSKEFRLNNILENIKSNLGQGNIIITSGTESMSQMIGNFVADLQNEVFNKKNNVEEVYLYTESFDL